MQYLKKWLLYWQLVCHIIDFDRAYTYTYMFQNVQFNKAFIYEYRISVKRLINMGIRH